MRKVEVAHNSPEQVAEYIGSALATLEQLGIEQDAPLAGVAFAKAIDLHAAKQLILEQAGMVPDLRGFGGGL